MPNSGSLFPSFGKASQSRSVEPENTAAFDQNNSQEDGDDAPHISPLSIAQLLFTTVISAGSVGAQFAPVPGLSTAFSVLKNIITTVENVQRNQ